jgi:hypothetical protein
MSAGVRNLHALLWWGCEHAGEGCDQFVIKESCTSQRGCGLTNRWSIDQKLVDLALWQRRWSESYGSSGNRVRTSGGIRIGLPEGSAT